MLSTKVGIFSLAMHAQLMTLRDIYVTGWARPVIHSVCGGQTAAFHPTYTLKQGTKSTAPATVFRTKI